MKIMNFPNCKQNMKRKKKETGYATKATKISLKRQVFGIKWGPRVAFSFDQFNFVLLD